MAVVGIREPTMEYYNLSMEPSAGVCDGALTLVHRQSIYANLESRSALACLRTVEIR